MTKYKSRLSQIPSRLTQKSFCAFLLDIRVLLLLLFVFLPTIAYTAELRLTSDVTSPVGVGQQFQVNLMLDTQGEEINALEGKVIFPEDLLELKEIRDGNSIISFWLDRPRINTDINTNKHEIVFSGITPGGYRGEAGLLFSLILQAKKEGEAIMEIQEVKTLLNDGQGTETKSSVKHLLVLISADISVPSWVTPEDTEPPEDFKPEIASDPTIFEGKWFLVFQTQDKDSGIDYYEVLEADKRGYLRGLTRKAKWERAESPYVLQDQELRSYIYVKAVDKAGNERIATLSPQNPLKWYESWWVWVIIILLVVITLVFRLVFRSRLTRISSR